MRIKPTIVIIGAGLIVVGLVSHHSKTPTHAANVNSDVSASSSRFEIVVSQSSCQENPGLAYINCSIGVRNLGGAAGVPNVFVLYRYSDSGETLDSSGLAVDRGDSQPSDAIPPHTLGFVYFSHPYKATSHDLIQAATSLSDDAKSMPFIRVANPGADWP